MKLKEIAENHGLTPEGVDYALTQYQIVICEITHGMMSKLSYDANDIIRMAQERWCDTCDLKGQEPIEPKVTKRKTGFGNVLSCWFDCGNCNKPIEHLTYRFCPYCGKGIKWDESEKAD